MVISSIQRSPLGAPYRTPLGALGPGPAGFQYADVLGLTDLPTWRNYLATSSCAVFNYDPPGSPDAGTIRIFFRLERPPSWPGPILTPSTYEDLLTWKFVGEDSSAEFDCDAHTWTKHCEGAGDEWDRVYFAGDEFEEGGKDHSEYALEIASNELSASSIEIVSIGLHINYGLFGTTVPGFTFGEDVDVVMP